MKATIDLRRTGAALAAVLIAVGGVTAAGARERADTIRFAPQQGLTLTKRLLIKHELGLDRVGFAREGAPVQADGTTGWLSTWQKITVTDRYDEVGGGRPTKFVRTYDDASAGGKLTMQRSRNEKIDDKAVSVSPLRKYSVAFTWVPEESDWSRMYDHLDADEAWLANITGDMDLLTLLPPGEVSVGDTWEIAVNDLREIFAPGGNLQITPRTPNRLGRSIKVGLGGDYADMLGEELVGPNPVATYVGVREVEGKRLAEVQMDISILSIADRMRLYALAMPDEEKAEKSQLRSVIVQYKLDGKGVLLWDLDGGHFHSFEVTGREEYHLAIDKLASEGGAPFEVSEQSFFSGNLNFSFAVGEPEPESEAGGAGGGQGGK